MPLKSSTNKTHNIRMNNGCKLTFFSSLVYLVLIIKDISVLIVFLSESGFCYISSLPKSSSIKRMNKRLFYLKLNANIFSSHDCAMENRMIFLLLW